MSNSNERDNEYDNAMDSDSHAGISSRSIFDDDYIEYAYQTVLGRSSDAAGKAYWLHELQSGHVDRTSLLNGFSVSAEGQEHAHAAAGSTATMLNDDSYVENAYQSVLGRSSDAAGKAYWLHELQSGHIDRTSLLNDFSASAEGREHLSLVGVSTISHDLMLLG